MAVPKRPSQQGGGSRAPSHTPRSLAVCPLARGVSPVVHQTPALCPVVVSVSHRHGREPLGPVGALPWGVATFEMTQSEAVSTLVLTQHPRDGEGTGDDCLGRRIRSYPCLDQVSTRPSTRDSEGHRGVGAAVSVARPAGHAGQPWLAPCLRSRRALAARVCGACVAGGVVRRWSRRTSVHG